MQQAEPLVADIDYAPFTARFASLNREEKSAVAAAWWSEGVASSAIGQVLDIPSEDVWRKINHFFILECRRVCARGGRTNRLRR